MRKALKLIPNKTILKYLFVILIFLILGNTAYLLKYSNKETPIIKKHPKYEIRKILYKADIFYASYNLDSAYYHYNKAQSLCNTRTQYIDYVYALTCMADIDQIQGDFVASEISLTKTLPYLKKIKKPRFAANVYETFGGNYIYTYDYNNALLYFTKALHLKTSSYRKIVVLNSISQIYIRQKKFKLAESILISLSKIKIIFKNDKVTNDSEYARILDDLGLCYQAQGKPEALFYYKKSLEIKIRLNDYYSLLYTNMHIAEHFQISNPALAYPYAKKAYMFAFKLDDARNKLQGLKVLTKTSPENNLKKYINQFIQLADSIEKVEKSTKSQFSRIKYYSKKDKTENLQLKAEKAENELEIEKQKNRHIISYVLIVLIISFITFLYFHLKSKGRKQKDTAIFESEIRISKKLSDELTHEIYQTLTHAQNNDLEKEVNKEKLLNNLDFIYSKIRNISKENSPVVIDKNYPIALKEMISGFQTSEVNFILNGFDSILWNKIDKNKKITIYRVLHEILLNMKKHSNASLVVINFKTGNNQIFINYVDNGKGIPINNISFNKGLQNVENRILSIKGEIDIDSTSDMGFKVFIKLTL